MTISGMARSWQCATSRPSPASVSGSTQTWAGPPTRIVTGQRGNVGRGDVAMHFHLGGALALLKGRDHVGEQRRRLAVEMRYACLEAEAVGAMAFATIAGKVRVCRSLRPAGGGTE